MPAKKRKRKPAQAPATRTSTPRIDVTRDASICVVAGVPGSGKSSWLKRRAATHAAHGERVLVWDVDAEYGHAGAVYPDIAVGLIGTIKRGNKFIVFRPRLVKFAEQFDFFCRAALASAPCVVVVDELADVTTPGKAPAGWGTLIRRGRKYGVTVYAATARPAESDKTSFSLATSLWIGQAGSRANAEYMANQANVPIAEIESLTPLEFLLRDRRANTLKREKLTF